jgi:hypothetical protein
MKPYIATNRAPSLRTTIALTNSVATSRTVVDFPAETETASTPQFDFDFV